MYTHGDGPKNRADMHINTHIARTHKHKIKIVEFKL